jgi:hypothetical protein
MNEPDGPEQREADRLEREELAWQHLMHEEDRADDDTWEEE